MLLVSKYKGYLLYYDPKYNDFLVVTPNYKITRYWKRLGQDIGEYFDKKVSEYLIKEKR